MPLVFQHGAEGYAEHDAVWGLFAWGGSGYAGGYLRVLAREPGGGLQVVNGMRGSLKGLIFEVR